VILLINLTANHYIYDDDSISFAIFVDKVHIDNNESGVFL
jgi:hypothetical protein